MPKDTTPPTVTFSSNTTLINQLNTEVEFSVVAVEKESTISKVEIFEGDKLLGTATLSGDKYTFKTKIATKGQHTFKVRVTNGAGLKTESVLIVTADPDAPTVAATTATPVITSVPKLVEMNITASDQDGTITKVQVFAANDLQNPLGDALPKGNGYVFPYQIQTSGVHQFVVKATDNAGNVGQSQALVILADGTPPTGTLTASASLVNVFPTKVTLNASVADPETNVSKVEFYEGLTLIGTDTTAPYTVDHVVSTSGNKAYIARIYNGADATFDTQKVIVDVDLLPAVQLEANSNIVDAPGVTQLVATASDDIGIAKVEFYEGDVKLGEDTQKPYILNYQATTVGPKEVIARAIDTRGQAVNSVAATFTVKDSTPPVVSLKVGNWDGQVPTLKDAPLVLEADSFDPESGIEKVEFYLGDKLVGTDATAPYTADVQLTGDQVGNLVLTARAYNKEGLTQQSAEVYTSAFNPGPSFKSVNFSSNRIYLGDPFTVNVEVEDRDSIARVELLDWWTDKVLVTDTSAPYSLEYAPAKVGNQPFVVRAYDQHGNANTYWVTFVEVMDPTVPTVLLQGSSSESSTIKLPGSLTLTANASVKKGNITKVEFYKWGVLLGEDATAPYEYTDTFPLETQGNWNSHQYQAVVYTDLSKTASSNTFYINTEYPW
ncbi:Ig-like domain-containing protein [Deinococcus cellulosilyticus]|uniref:Ig-like domain-containing protein n=1 Tax=Deinococcus cellulosilyticus TaxID=401558 RepID=UPI0011BF01E0|nr:Ig-like domain-containing protein [Deinococcus cellulosilyticus]